MTDYQVIMLGLAVYVVGAVVTSGLVAFVNAAYDDALYTFRGWESAMLWPVSVCAVVLAALVFPVVKFGEYVTVKAAQLGRAAAKRRKP